MRGKDESSGSLFSYVDLEARVPRRHPLRAIRDLMNAALVEMSGAFEALYSRTGRPGIAPEKLLRALLLHVFYSIRSERQLMGQLEFNLLFRWFVGLGIDDRVWDATVFTKNRERLLAPAPGPHVAARQGMQVNSRVQNAERRIVQVRRQPFRRDEYFHGSYSSLWGALFGKLSASAIFDLLSINGKEITFSHIHKQVEFPQDNLLCGHRCAIFDGRH